MTTKSDTRIEKYKDRASTDDIGLMLLIVQENPFLKERIQKFISKKLGLNPEENKDNKAKIKDRSNEEF